MKGINKKIDEGISEIESLSSQVRKVITDGQGGYNSVYSSLSSDKKKDLQNKVDAINKIYSENYKLKQEYNKISTGQKYSLEKTPAQVKLDPDNEYGEFIVPVK